MSKTLQLRRGPTSEATTVTLADGELFIDTSLKRLYVHDGVTVGGVDAGLSSANVAALAGLTGAADKLPYFTGSGTMTLANLTAAGRALIDDDSSAAMLVTLGAAKSMANSDITSLTGLTTALSVLQGGSGVTTSTGTGNNVLSASPTFSGTPLAPTAAPGTNTTQLATTAYSLAAAIAAVTGANSTITSLTGLTTPLTIAQGGTGVNAQAFTSLTLANSWTLAAGGRAGYRKITNDFLYLEMRISGGTATDGTVLTTLPAGNRPPNQIVVPVASPPNTALSTTVAGPRVVINTDGTITCSNCSNGSLQFVVSFSLI